MSSEFEEEVNGFFERGEASSLLQHLKTADPSKLQLKSFDYTHAVKGGHEVKCSLLAKALLSGELFASKIVPILIEKGAKFTDDGYDFFGWENVNCFKIAVGLNYELPGNVLSLMAKEYADNDIVKYRMAGYDMASLLRDHVNGVNIIESLSKFQDIRAPLDLNAFEFIKDAPIAFQLKALAALFQIRYQIPKSKYNALVEIMNNEQVAGNMDSILGENTPSSFVMKLVSCIINKKYGDAYSNLQSFVSSGGELKNCATAIYTILQEMSFKNSDLFLKSDFESLSQLNESLRQYAFKPTGALYDKREKSCVESLSRESYGDDLEILRDINGNKALVQRVMYKRVFQISQDEPELKVDLMDFIKTNYKNSPALKKIKGSVQQLGMCDNDDLCIETPSADFFLSRFGGFSYKIPFRSKIVLIDSESKEVIRTSNISEFEQESNARLLEIMNYCQQSDDEEDAENDSLDGSGEASAEDTCTRMEDNSNFSEAAAAAEEASRAVDEFGPATSDMPAAPASAAPPAVPEVFTTEELLADAMKVDFTPEAKMAGNVNPDLHTDTM